MQLDGWFSDVFKFKAFEGKKFLGAIGKKPSRLLTGVDPWSTKVWNTVKGSHDVGLVDQWGGTSKENVRAAKKAGINIGPGMTVEAIAHMVASFYAGGALGKAVTNGKQMFEVAQALKKVTDKQNAPVMYTPPDDPRAMSAQSLQVSLAPAMSQQYAMSQGFAPGEPIPGGSFYPPPVLEVSHAKLPEWVIPAGIGAAALVLVSILRR